MSYGKIALFAIVGIVVLGLALYAISQVSVALAPPDPNANKNTANIIRTDTINTILKKDQFPLTKTVVYSTGLAIPAGDNMALVVNATVKGDGLVHVALAKDDKGTCPCDEFYTFKGDKNPSFWISNENSIVKQIKAGEKIFLKFSTDSTTEQSVIASMAVRYDKTVVIPK